MFPVEMLQQLLQGSQQLPPLQSLDQFAPIPFEGGMPSPGKGVPSFAGGLGGLLPGPGAPQNGIMPFQRDQMMQAVLGQLSQPNFGIPQFEPRKRRVLGGGIPFAPGGMPTMGGRGGMGATLRHMMY